jgi:hypothetical protein
LGGRSTQASSLKETCHNDFKTMDEVSNTIGSATMTDDGTIILDLRAEGPGICGDARLVYPPTHEQYAAILKHLGAIKPGEHKLVPGWTE